MTLWGKVARGLLLVLAAVFIVLAGVAPEMRREAMVAVVITMAAALLGVPALVRLFSSFTGDEAVLASGTPGSATITSLKETRWRYNRQYPIVRFGLNVDAAGVYATEIKQAVDPDVLAQLAPGAVVAVRVDPSDRKKLVIDWRQPVRSAAGAIVEAKSTGDARGTVTPTSRRSAWPLLRWLCLVFGLIFLRLGCEAGYYETDGARVDGVVIQKTYSPGTRSTGGSQSSPARHSVSYRFTTKEGRTLEGRADVLPRTWRELEKGGRVVVEYVPSSPDTNRIPDQLARSHTWGVMAAVLLVASGVLFVINRRRRSTEKPS